MALIGSSPSDRCGPPSRRLLAPATLGSSETNQLMNCDALARLMPDQIRCALDRHLQFEPVFKLRDAYRMVLGQELLDQVPDGITAICQLQTEPVHVL